MTSFFTLAMGPPQAHAKSKLAKWSDLKNTIKSESNFIAQRKPRKANSPIQISAFCVKSGEGKKKESLQAEVGRDRGWKQKT